MNPKVAILYIGIGRYTIFWESFYHSCQQLLFPNVDKHYFVFTDSHTIQNSDDITTIFQMDMGWPMNTLYRFRMFLRIENRLKDFDYIYFFNGNSQIVEVVTPEEMLKEGLTVVKHPGYWNKDEIAYPLEKNKLSTAYCKSAPYYVAGGVNGGSKKEYLELVKCCYQKIEDDMANGIIAVWHDESQLNKYIQDKPINLLSPSYCYPENWNLPFTPKIIMRDKNKYGGHDYLRGITRYKSSKVKRTLHKLINRLPI